MVATVTKTVGSSGRAFSTAQSWEDGAPVNLITTEKWSAGTFTGSFQQGETVSGVGLTAGKYLDGDGSSYVVFGIVTGNTATLVTLTGTTSGATCVVGSKTDTGIIWRGELYNDTEFTVNGTVLVVSGSTTDATSYKELTTGSGQSFVDNVNAQTNALHYNVANGVGLRTTNGYSGCTSIQENFTRVGKIQFSAAKNAAMDVPTSGISGVDINQIIVETTSTAANSARVRAGKIRNSLIVNRANTGDGLSFDYVTSGQAINVTVVRPSDKTKAGAAFTAASAGATLKNCAAFGFTNEVNNSSRFTATTCYTDKVTPMTGFTTIAYDTTTGSGFQNITDATYDYRIKSSSGLIGVATADSTNAAFDIVGTSRPQGGAYDVGCWEFKVAPSGFPAYLFFFAT